MILSLLLMAVVFKPYTVVVGDEGTPEEMKLIQAAKDGDITTIKALIKSGRDVNAKDGKNSLTVLMWAVTNGCAEIVQILL